MKEEKATPGRQPGMQDQNQICSDFCFTDTTNAQRKRILDFLGKNGPLSTLKARQELNVMHPAARVMELRRQGFNIVTNWRIDYTDRGKPHRVAEYVLFNGESSAFDMR